MARAYLDQLTRSKAIQAPRASAVKSAIDKADKDKPAKSCARSCSTRWPSRQLEKDAAAATGTDAMRMKALASTIKTRTAKLRT